MTTNITTAQQAALAATPVCRFTADELQAALHFSSGVNAHGEVHGLINNAINVGITAGEIRDGLLAALEQYGSQVNTRVFVDSAAFSEVAWSPELGRLVVVKPISDAAWLERFELYTWAARTFGRRAQVVAPDVVGDQAATLVRLARWASQVNAVAELGASVIIPVQKGELPMSAMWRACRELLAVDDDHAIAGVPMKKDATSLEDLAELAASLPPRARLHLLGLGPESTRFAGAIATIRRHCPTARITSDSVTLRRLVGRTNGRGNGPRIMTSLQDKARAENGGAKAYPHGVKNIAITWWRMTQCTIEDAYDRRRLAGELGLG